MNDRARSRLLEIVRRKPGMPRAYLRACVPGAGWLLRELEEVGLVENRGGRRGAWYAVEVGAPEALR